MAKYKKKAQDKVAKTMHEHKHQGKYKNKQQAIAAGLSMARQDDPKAAPEPEDK
jgi:hypothetical protein